MTDIASIISAFYSSQCIHPGHAQAWPCGSNQSAVVLLHQMLTLPCNTQRAIFGLDAFPFGLWGMAVCLLGRSVRPTWRLVWHRGGSVETTCGDMSPTMTWLIPRHVAVSGLLAYRLEACSHSFLVLLGCVGVMPLKQILPHGTRDMRGEVWH